MSGRASADHWQRPLLGTQRALGDPSPGRYASCAPSIVPTESPAPDGAFPDNLAPTDALVDVAGATHLLRIKGVATVDYHRLIHRGQETSPVEVN